MPFGGQDGGGTSHRERSLVTGASGFVGAALVRLLLEAGHDVVAASHSRGGAGMDGAVPAAWHRADLACDPLDPLLEGVGSVIHAAGIAHARVPESRHRRVTVEGTRRLVEAMQRCGPRRLVFISSIRAQVGSYSLRVVADHHTASPQDAYGRAKRDAEEIIAASGLDFTILRPVLVADVGARGNLALLLRLARQPLPLPFAGLAARRSLVSRRALADAVLFALRTEACIGRRFDVADGAPLDLAQIATILRRGLGKSPGLVAWPEKVLQGGLHVLGRGDVYDRLARPLVIAADGLHGLGWSAPEWAAQALYRMARHAAAAARPHSPPPRG